MIDFLKTLNKDENYCVLHNGVIEKTNIDLKDLDIKKDISFTLIHTIDEDCEISIIINEGVKANIIEIFYPLKEVKINKNIIAKKNSELDICTIECNLELDTNSSGKNETSLCVNVKTVLNDNAYINNRKLSVYKSNVLEDEEVLLQGKKSHIENLNILINSNNKVQNNNMLVTHEGIDTESKMTNFGICKGNSTLNINTNGKVLKDAIRSNINQKSKGILLDTSCSISANPWLQIDEYDCLASHGAGIGAIEEEELYYLESRGLTELESEKLIINGFINPIYDNIKNEELKKQIALLINF